MPTAPLGKYDNHETWTNKRWAWEFLRRNPQFIRACDELGPEPSPGRRRSLAKQFGLTQFKHYDEPFESVDGQYKQPQFVSKAVLPLRPERQPDGRWARTVTIRPGQFAVRFDLRAALTDDRIFSAQIATARKILEKQLAQWREEGNITPKSGRQRPMARLLQHLKVLDALTQASTSAEQAAIVWGPGTRAQRLTDALEDAMNLATTDYLLLAAVGNDIPPRK